MTREQEKHFDKALQMMSDAREELDIAMYSCGFVSDEEFIRMREFYDDICWVQDRR